VGGGKESKKRFDFIFIIITPRYSNKASPAPVAVNGAPEALLE
jgi:hypothetical protein